MKKVREKKMSAKEFLLKKKYNFGPDDIKKKIPFKERNIIKKKG